MAEEKEKKSKNNDVGPLGFDYKKALIGNMERGNPKRLKNLSTVNQDKELHNRFKNTMLGG
jgi:hypothetical protein